MPNKSNKTQTGRRVLFLSRLLSPHVGGVERHIDSLAKVLAKRGYRITVITEQHDTTLPLTQKNDLYTVHRIPHATRSKIGVWLWMFVHFHLFLRADLIHAHDVFWWALPMRFFLWWKPVFTTFHGYEGSRPPTQKAIRSRRVAERLSRANICVGAWMQKWYGTKPDAVIYGAAELIPLPPVTSHNAVFVGRLSEDTGVLDYIRGVQLAGGKVTLDIYGEGEQLDQVKNLIKNDPKVTYKGLAKHVPALLAQYRYACISRYLGMIEAMQAGRYVFAHWNNPIKRDYLDSFPGKGFASTFHLPEEFAQELHYVQTHPTEERLRAKQAADWAGKQRWEKVADIYEEIWNK